MANIQKIVKKMRKYLRMSEKSSNFAAAFEKMHII